MITVDPAHIVVCPTPTLLAATTDSSVVVFLRDPSTKAGGACHFIEPKAAPGAPMTARHGVAAVSELIKRCAKLGVTPERAEAYIVGGNVKPEGPANRRAARAVLSHRKISIRDEVPKAGSVTFDLGRGTLNFIAATRATTREALQLDDKTFKQFQTIIYELSGIALEDKKLNLMRTRLSKRLRQLGLTSHKDYLELIKADPDGDEVVRMLDVITTNFTHFSRDQQHFDFAAHRVAEWIRAGRRDVSIWCAASSTGEEPYNLMITIREHLEAQNLGGNVRMLATDLSTKALAQAQAGIYDSKDLSKLSSELRDKYFVASPGNDRFEISPRIRSAVHFGRLNLDKVPYAMAGPFDIVFLRNVLIYFQEATRNKVVTECHRLMRPGGYLVVGSSESLLAMNHLFEGAAPSIYRKR